MQSDSIQRRIIRGDWMTNGFIENLNRRRALDVAIVDGRAYLLDVDEHTPDLSRPVRLDVAGEICGWGASTSFSPDPGEIARLGVPVPEDAP